MKFMQRLCLMALWIACLTISASAQSANAPAATQDVLLTVGGEVEHPLKLTRSDLDKFTRQTIRAKDHDGKEYKYEGVAIVDILQKAGVKFGDALRGKALATYLLVEAMDGYQAVYALPEFDPPTNDRLILLADRQDGAAFPAAAGPLKIIAPGDKTHARWVRQVKALTIMRAPKSVSGGQRADSRAASFRQVHLVFFRLESSKAALQIVWHCGFVIERAGV